MSSNSTYLRNGSGKIIGRLEVKSNGDKVLWDSHGYILGRYHAMNNTTCDRNGRIVGRCDILMTLLRWFINDYTNIKALNYNKSQISFK